MSEWDSSMSEHENMVSKAADIRELIFDGHPNWSEMAGCPYSVLCYAEKHIKEQQQKLAKAIEALEIIEMRTGSAMIPETSRVCLEAYEVSNKALKEVKERYEEV